MFGSVVKVRVRFRQVVIVVRVRVSVQEINTSLCKYPKSYLSKPVCVCVCVCVYVDDKLKQVAPFPVE